MEAQLRWYRESLKLNGEVVADVGANVGTLSQFFFKAVGSKGRVVSIEPIPANIRAIEKRMRRVSPKAKKRWGLKRCAVSSEVGTLTMRVLNASWGTNSVVSGDGQGEQLAVDCHPLHELVPAATVVKVDIEGHEYAILPSALKELPRVHSWALELHCIEGHPLEETLALFEQHGFQLFAAGQKNADPKSGWKSVPIASSLGWQQIPGTPTILDGLPNTFKMLHVLALRGSAGRTPAG